MQSPSRLERGAHRLGATSGNAMIELALLLPLLLLVLFGITEVGRAIATTATLNAAAREGARIGAVTAPDVNLINARVNEVLDAASVTPSSITVEGPLGMAEQTVRVTVRSDFDVLSGTILDSFAGTITLRGVAVMRHEAM